MGAAQLGTALALVALMAVGAPAAAAGLSGGPSGDCESNPDGCGDPSPPPPPPDLPAPVATTGYSWVNLNGAQPDFQHINNGQTQVVYGAATRTYGNGSTGTTLTTTLAPLATATADSYSQGMGEGVQGVIALGYTVILHANDQSGADAVAALIAANQSIARVSGSYATTQSGAGYATVHASTSGDYGQFGHVFASGCNGGGQACGTGRFTLALGFQSATDFLNGDPLDFVGTISLESDAFAGLTPYTYGTAPGSAHAFIDPLITLNPALTNLLTLTVGGGQIANATTPGGGPGTGGVGLHADRLRPRGERHAGDESPVDTTGGIVKGQGVRATTRSAGTALIALLAFGGPAAANVTLIYTGVGFNVSPNPKVGTDITGFVVLHSFDSTVGQDLNATDLVDWSISNGNYTLSKAAGNSLQRFDMLVAAGGQPFQWAFDAQDVGTAQWTQFSRTDSYYFDISVIKDDSYSGELEAIGQAGQWSIAAGVPEPAAWGMMLAGFGAMGAVMRSRRTVTVRFA